MLKYIDKITYGHIKIINKLRIYQREFIKRTTETYRRYLFKEVNFDNRLIGIIYLFHNSSCGMHIGVTLYDKIIYSNVHEEDGALS